MTSSHLKQKLSDLQREFESDGLQGAALAIKKSFFRHIAPVIDPFYRELSSDSTSLELKNNTVELDTRNTSIDSTAIFNFAYVWETEQDMIERFISEIEAGDTVYDVGGHIGLYSVFAAKHNPNAHVHAFEPNEGLRVVLNQNKKLNKLENLTINSVALGDDEKEMWSYKYNLYSERVNSDATKIQLMPGDNFSSQSETAPNILKIDVDGWELDVLRGFDTALREDVRVLFCEVHPRLLQNRGQSDVEVYELLESYDFTVKARYSRDDEIHLIAYKDELESTEDS